MNLRGLTVPVPPERSARCLNCGRLTTAPVTVRRIETPSGPGRTLYACPACAPLLVPGPGPVDCGFSGSRPDPREAV
ncbi:hypothetical protein ACFYT4_04010 [Streptomyces sp. NPDC004609]|uniref:hypothetical protein n=1 Tax=Streptomyces sp. NPDC004609 TaxID=3364704 RepID=UPI0036A957FC